MEKKTKIIILVVVFAVVMIVGIMLWVSILNKEEKIVLNEDFILLDENYLEKENRVFTNYEDYYQKFSSNILNEEDFKNNNYVLITISDNSCSNSSIAPTDYTLNGNNIFITAKYRAQCSECAVTYKAYLLKVSKDIEEVVVSINSIAVNDIKC